MSNYPTFTIICAQNISRTPTLSDSSYVSPVPKLPWVDLCWNSAGDFETSLVGPGKPWTNETSWNTFWNYLLGLVGHHHIIPLWMLLHKPKPKHYNKFAQMFESALKYHCNKIPIHLGGQAVHMSLQIWITLPKKLTNKCTGLVDNWSPFGMAQRGRCEHYLYS